ncbi:hypothetical protein GKZ90_0014910 [Flavobacterium sp. MC2016-06]|jgi:hypothetical protein|uniref:hypothetical protein n=1 Tax=Flavobacterium sp. MC2016-06 TaxID=2676308 RepID=UPI0012BA7D84|nr:hypothetical protein [Flavobacterium sp. MC2016-06]MBU3859311.1 hypothetical protein [Flavobacterium sp. MC2016-06]
MKIVLENKGIKTDTFYIPPFVLYEGEAVSLYLYNGKHLYDTEVFLRNIFCGKIKHENVILHRKMTFVEYFRRSYFRDTFFPLTVGRYLKGNSNLKSPFSKKIFEIEWITGKTKIEKLPGTPRKLLTLYATLSKTKDIVFDLGALDSEGSEFVFKMVKEAVKDGGSAILLDCFDDAKKHASKVITLEWNNGIPPPENEFHFNF